MARTDVTEATAVAASIAKLPQSGGQAAVARPSHAWRLFIYLLALHLLGVS